MMAKTTQERMVTLVGDLKEEISHVNNAIIHRENELATLEARHAQLTDLLDDLLSRLSRPSQIPQAEYHREAAE